MTIEEKEEFHKLKLAVANLQEAVAELTRLLYGRVLGTLEVNDVMKLLK